MISFWQRLNHLVPDPLCRTRGNRIVEWTDPRPQPTDADIAAVTDADVQAAIDDALLDRLEAGDVDVLLIIAKAFHNHENRIRALEGSPAVTLRQVIAALRAL
jgi:hypothetical protein